MKALSTLKKTPQYVFPDFDPVKNKGISDKEYEILFSDGETPLGFCHNDLQLSNIVGIT